MKKTIVVTVLMTLTFLASSQTFLQENKTWNTVECMNFGGCETKSFKITGDTSIGQVNYMKLYSTYDTTLTNWYIYGAMREYENQVFIYNFYLESEELLYDFNLSVGDTFSTLVSTQYYLECPIDIVLTSIDTVLLENNEQRQRFNFGSEQWISGIGSLYGLLYVDVYSCSFDLFCDLSCCHENDELIYQSPHFDNCVVNTVGLNENSIQLNHSVYPNPFSQSTVLKFDYSVSQNYRLQIINSTGQLVKEIDNIYSGEVHINGNQLKKGIYYYRLITDHNDILTGKLMKNE